MTQLFPRITPEKYTLSLHPDMTTFTFTGQEMITFRTPNKLKKFTFHALHIVVEKATLVVGNEIFVPEISYNPDEQTVTFSIPEEVRPGSKQLSLRYSGVLGDRMKIWYKNNLLPENSKDTLSVTKIEEIGGREALVCVDELQANAILDVITLLSY